MLDHPRAQRLRLYVQVAGEHLVVVLEELAGSREVSVEVSHHEARNLLINDIVIDEYR
jgi:hypothetical protein